MPSDVDHGEERRPLSFPGSHKQGPRKRQGALCISTTLPHFTVTGLTWGHKLLFPQHRSGFSHTFGAHGRKVQCWILIALPGPVSSTQHRAHQQDHWQRPLRWPVSGDLWTGPKWPWMSPDRKQKQESFLPSEKGLVFPVGSEGVTDCNSSWQKTMNLWKGLSVLMSIFFIYI